MPTTDFVRSFRDLRYDAGRRVRADMSLHDERELLHSLAVGHGVDPTRLRAALSEMHGKNVALSTAYRMIHRHGYKPRRETTA